MNIESTNVSITDEARNGRSAICYAHLYHADCFDIMPKIESKSIDLILADLPYGTTACKWDSVLPFDKLWNEYERLITDNGAIVLFGSQPFTSILINSNLNLFRYEIIWHKERPTNPLFAKKGIMKYHENICIFYKKMPVYNSQMTKKEEKNKRNNTPRNYVDGTKIETNKYSEMVLKGNAEHIYPNSVLRFNMERGLHPTQKPIELLKYLIKTYTNKGMTILDNTMGSGSTGVAAKMLQRNFIGIEKELNYFEIAQKRIDNTIIEPSIFDCA